jgi:hypothetical protein
MWCSLRKGKTLIVRYSALWSLVSTHSFPSLISCFSAAFFVLNKALDLITTLLKVRSWVNSIWAIAVHAPVAASTVAVARIRCFP